MKRRCRAVTEVLVSPENRLESSTEAEHGVEFDIDGRRAVKRVLNVATPQASARKTEFAALAGANRAAHYLGRQADLPRHPHTLTHREMRRENNSQARDLYELARKWPAEAPILTNRGGG
jgi:hypothetical protein